MGQLILQTKWRDQSTFQGLIFFQSKPWSGAAVVGHLDALATYRRCTILLIYTMPTSIVHFHLHCHQLSLTVPDILLLRSNKSYVMSFLHDNHVPTSYPTVRRNMLLTYIHIGFMLHVEALTLCKLIIKTAYPSVEQPYMSQIWHLRFNISC